MAHTWVQVKAEKPPLWPDRPWMVVIQNPTRESSFMAVDRFATEAEAEQVGECCFLMVDDILETERERCAKIALSMADAYGAYPDRASLAEIADRIRQS